MNENKVLFYSYFYSGLHPMSFGPHLHEVGPTFVLSFAYSILGLSPLGRVHKGSLKSLSPNMEAKSPLLSLEKPLKYG